MVATSIEDFHQWRTISAGRNAPSIVISVGSHYPGDLPAQVGRYLNEYDEAADGRWTSFSTELLKKLSLSNAEQALLAVPAGCVNCPIGSVCNQKKICKAIAGFGYSILEGPLAVEGCKGMGNIFRVAVGMPPEEHSEFHLSIQPDRFAVRCLPVLIGDTYLEWQATHELVDNV